MPPRQYGVLMRFLLGWGVRLGFLAGVCLFATGNMKLTMPDAVLGHQVPPQAKRWAERAEIGDLGARTQASFREISDRIR